MKKLLSKTLLLFTIAILVTATTAANAAAGPRHTEHKQKDLTDIDCQAPFLPIEGSDPTGSIYSVDQTAIGQIDAIEGMTSYSGVYDSHDVYNPDSDVTDPDTDLLDAGYWISTPDKKSPKPMDVLVYAHGFRPPVNADGFTPLTLTGRELVFQKGDANAVQAFAVENDMAILASTYSKNNYVPVQGALDTCELVKYFATNIDEFAEGRNIGNVYIYGASMGGGVAAISAEKYGNVYNAAMPVCGVVGDFYQTDYLLDANYIGQHLTTGSFELPDATNQAEVEAYLFGTVPAIRETLGLQSTDLSNPTAPLTLTTKGELLKEILREETSGNNPIYDYGFNHWLGNRPGLSTPIPGYFIWEFGLAGALPASAEFSNGESANALDNTGDYVVNSKYLAANPDQAMLLDTLNAQTDRLTPDVPGGRPAAFEITGDLDMKVLTLHNLGDMFVPFQHEIEYYNNVKQSGQKRKLVQRAIRNVGHCDFTDAETIDALEDLVKWVEKGKKPKGDKIKSRRKIAKANFGCKFTDEHGTRQVPSADIPLC